MENLALFNVGIGTDGAMCVAHNEDLFVAAGKTIEDYETELDSTGLDGFVQDYLMWIQRGIEKEEEHALGDNALED